VEALMEMARKGSDQAELYSLEETSDGIGFENGVLKDIESKSQSGISLRIVKEGKLGFAYTKNLINRQEFLQNALDSLKGEVEALFDLPLTSGIALLDTFDPSLEKVANSSIVDECNRVCGLLGQKTTGQINVSAWRKISRIRLMNSQGTDLNCRFSFYSFNAEILYPGSHASIHRPLFSKNFEKTPGSYLDFILDLYNRSSKEVSPKGGKMKVLFLPETLYALMWRIQSAANGKNVYQKVSPIMEKMGSRLLSKKISIYNDPLDDRLPGARGFDDEGVPCRTVSIIDEGALANFYFNLHYAKKMAASPTGHGFKSSMWGGETISFPPSPSLEHLCLKPGAASFRDLVESTDRGMIAAGVMGAHSGNILNGDFSVGLSPGLYVEKGKILGHVKDAMVAGNVYDALNEVVGLEDTAHPSYGGTFPAVLLDHVSVAIKG
jgi:PmbA protein